MKTKVLLTLGDPNSISPEVCVKSLTKLSPEQLSRLIVIGDSSTIDRYFPPALASSLRFEIIDPSASGIGFRLSPGTPDPSAGAMSFLFLRRAVELLQSGKASYLVTAPVSKSLIVRSGLPGTANFRGHTDYLAESFGITSYSMMFHSPDLKVILATIHTPLKKVPAELSAEKIDIALKNALLYYNMMRVKDFRIAVCGLNPHAGESGLLGGEDSEIIAPVVESYRAKGYNIEGPLPADTVFFHAYRGKYDMVIAMYHDQGLAPFKMLHFIDGVNITLGLPFLRTSPDHGTAFDIAGKNIADETSMDQSIDFIFKADESWKKHTPR
ncbi:MAG: 4-hydroxythreonine-4-phosphate dehydrogenase PdxA [Brevinematales bacterium]|nr:4-hydroxythreonine-4-phosphate dehydrogenase PdxA [Brevinematales bacterium]